MKQNILSKIILLIILFIIFFIMYLKLYNDEIKNLKHETKIYKTICGEYKKGEIKIGEVLLTVNIADDNCKSVLGLSGKDSLNKQGMFFVFEKMGNYAFWMKDMKFPIDILWIDDTFSIVGIENNIFPNTYPESFGSKYKALYVLEVPAGYSEKNNIKIGDKIIFTEK